MPGPSMAKKARDMKAKVNRKKEPKEDRNRAPRREYLAGETIVSSGLRGSAKQKVTGSGQRVTFVGPTSTVIRDQRALMGDTYETRFETERPPRTVKVAGKYK